jgi:hypothetical protein
MHSHFDWLRRSRTGSELLSTLQYLASYPELPEAIGPPHSALAGPCLRCWLYPRSTHAQGHGRYCETCELILRETHRLLPLSRSALVIWGYVNRLPEPLRPGGRRRDQLTYEPYVHDDQHFLLMLPQRNLRAWLQDLAIYDGPDLKGLLQLFPAGGVRDTGMGDLLCRVVQNDARFPLDTLRIRFFARAQQIFAPALHERQGVLTFGLSEFLNALEMAAVFRVLLGPEEQEQLYQVLTLEQGNEERFYWGRLLAGLSQEARDLLQSWRLRQWSRPQLNLLYELMRYVEFHAPSANPS